MTANRRVLVVEDDEDLGEMLTEQLQIHEEFITELVNSGTSAIELTKDQYFDTIILDVVSSPLVMYQFDVEFPALAVSCLMTDVDERDCTVSARC